MRIAVLGTGMVGQALAGRLAELGHEVTVGTRDPESTLADKEPDMMGNPLFADCATENPGVRLATFAEAAAGAELLVNATPGTVSLAALEAAGAENMAGKILIDVANAIDDSHGFPPRLVFKDTESLGEQIQAAFIDVKVVKTLSTLAAPLMIYPEQLNNGDHTVFVAGNDAEAKLTVVELLRSFGHTDIIDLGDIKGARGVEAALPLWLRLLQTLNTSIFNFKVVR